METTPYQPLDRVTANRLRHLAEGHGTPLWVYDAAQIRRNVSKLAAFDVIRYAQKANANTHVLALLRTLGVKVDAVSGGEIERALAAGFVAGRDSEEIVYTADIFDRATLKQVVERDIPVNIGSISMLDQLGAVSPGHAIWLRVNPGFGHGHSRKTNTGGPSSKHGIWHENLPAALTLIERYGFDFLGLHMHIGSGANEAHLRTVCEAMVQVSASVGRPVRRISTGGGLPIPYRAGEREADVEQYFRCWDEACREIAVRQGTRPRLETEPGRYLIGNAGVLVAEVRAVKSMAGRHFTLVDAGMNDLVRPAMYGAFHRISLIPQDDAPRALVDTVVGGPLCESGDVFTQQADSVLAPVQLPEPKVGDLLVIHDTGAYGASMSSQYNARPLAPEILLDGATARLIRRRQTTADLLALETNCEPACV